MISADDFEEYGRRFGECKYLYPSNQLVVIDSDGKVYKAPEAEGAESFHDRLKRSIQEKRNLFYEEYTQFDPYPEKQAIY